MGKLILFFIISLPTFALVPENFLQDDVSLLDSLFLRIDQNQQSSKMPSEKYFSIIKDPKNRVSNTFKVPKYFSDSTRFWFNIYTRYSSDFVVVHDKTNLNTVIDVYNFTHLNKSIKNKHVKFSTQEKLTYKRIKKLKSLLSKMGHGKLNSKTAKEVLRKLRKYGVKIPSSKASQKKFFKKLAKNLRTQTGQRNHIRQGIINYIPFESLILKYFKLFKVPKELIAIPFLESSFNMNAKSRVGATGVWQFMRRVGRYFMPINKNIDSRLNPFISTISALYLLRQNKQILKRWDLSVKAYNSGTKHILRAKRKLKKPNMSLEDMLKYYEHPHIGFASKNFYSEFLALAHILPYKEEIFLDIPYQKKDSLHFDFYLTKCRFKPKRILGLLRKETSNIYLLNKHIKKRAYKGTLPRGTILVSDIPLNKKRYLKVKNKQLRSRYPKNWKRFLKGYNCSTI